MASTLCILEKGKIDDSEKICQVHTAAIKQLCSSHYGEKDISIWAGIQNKETYVPSLKSGNIIVAKKNGIVVGFIHHIEHTKEIDTNELSSDISKKICSNSEFEIKRLFVDPVYTRNGIGKLLVKEVETIALKRGVAIMTVPAAALNAVSFYSKMGFQEVERRPYPITCQYSIECMHMVKDLTKQ